MCTRLRNVCAAQCWSRTRTIPAEFTRRCPMQFGIFYIVQWHESRTQAQALHEALEQIELADQLGIDEVWLGEHHFSRHGLLSGLFSFAGHVAARTKRIRIGTAVSVLPFH